MGEIETLGILQEIEALVSDKLQVVSYKWLSRNFLVSSNVAKRLLQEFVEQCTSGLEVVYSLSGWLKNDPPSYHIRLVSRPKLEDAKQEFDGNYSVHIYSVQAAIPKDPAALWNDEFVQAEELFKQPSAIDNCLRDNRFCGIHNPFVKRNVDGAPVSNAATQPKSVGLSKSNPAHENIAVPPTKQIKVEHSGQKVGQQSSNLVKDVKIESLGTGAHNQSSKRPSDREKVPAFPFTEKKGQSNRSSSGNGGSLASLWGHASAKSKLTSAPAENCSINSNPTAGAEAQIFACEAIEDLSSDDEAQDVNFKRSSNGEGGRKRRVVLDYSDDENEDAVNLASPDLPKGKISKISSSEKSNLNQRMEDKPKVKEEKSTDGATNQGLREKSSASSKSNSRDSSKENMHNHITAPNSPKRRKVLKTRIDERGREVTEVIWEGEETETTRKDCNATKKAEDNAATNTLNNRAPAAAKKSPAVGNTAPNPGGKAGNNKRGNKDPKQGNILSFFKKV